MRRPALWLLACLLAVYLIAPFVAGLLQLGQADWAGADVTQLSQAVLVSVASASVATVLIAAGGIPLGYLLARRPGRWMAALGFVVQLPLALPPLASGVLLLFLLGYASPLGALTDGALTDSFTGIVLAEAFVAAPFLIIAARSAFGAVDPMLEDVAATLGHRPGAVFRRVSLKLAWRTILAGLLLTWLRAFGEFGATVMVAYHPYSLPVYTYVAFGSEGLPAMLPVLAPTLVAAVVVMLASLWAGAPRRHRVRALAETIPAPAPIAALPALDGQALAFAFHRRLDGFTLDVAWRTQARRLAILGASGSGKSLTLRLIAGLEAADSAALQLGGSDLHGLPPERRGVAYVPQSYGLFPHLSVAGQLRFPVDGDPALAQLWVARLGLTGLEHRLPAALSLGQQQRVALARALCRRRAPLLLLDEPFSALDAPLRLRLRLEMRALQVEVDATTILVTHDPAEAMMLADEMLLLDGGCVLQAGPVETLFLRPASETAARLLGAETVAHGTVVAPDCIDLGGGVRLPVAGPALTPGQRVGWAVRPEQIRLTDTGLPAMVLQREEAHDGWLRLTVRLGDAVLPMRADPGCGVGDACFVRIDPAVVQVWVADAQREA